MNRCLVGTPVLRTRTQECGLSSTGVRSSQARRRIGQRAGYAGQVIERIEYENYLVLKDVAIDFERFTMLVGPNACGKSTVLDSIPWLASENAKHVGVDLNRRTLGSQKHSRLVVRVDNHTAEIGSRNINFATIEAVEQATRGLHDVSVFRLLPNSLRAPATHKSAAQQISSDGSGLGAVLADITLDDPRRRDRIGETLTRVVPSSCGVSVVRSSLTLDTAYEPMVEFANVGKVSADRLSEGTLYALAIITALSTENRPKHVLIDDLDKGLHPSAQAELIAILRSFLADDPELQIIASTHSPYLLDHFEPREVRVMTLGDDGFARCRSLADHPNIEKWKGALAAGEMWSSVGESWIREPEAVAESQS
jgi:predicted ATPase